MLLENIGMIAADTSRTRAYLSALIRNDLLPSHIYLLQSGAGTALPGQGGGAEIALNREDCWSEADFDPAVPLDDLIKTAGLSSSILPTEDINAPTVVEALREATQSVMIYSGYGGALLRKDVLSTGKKFLHVHGGYLPNYRGSTTNYYSMLRDQALGASSLFLNAEIDGGPVLMRQLFPLPPNRQEIDHIYDSAIRAKVLVATIRRYLDSGEWEYCLPDNVGGDTYYIIHPVLKHIAILGKQA